MILYKYFPAERIDILENLQIRFTQPNAMNDPFEARPDFYITEEGQARELANVIRQAPITIFSDGGTATQERRIGRRTQTKSSEISISLNNYLIVLAFKFRSMI